MVVRNGRMTCRVSPATLVTHRGIVCVFDNRGDDSRDSGTWSIDIGIGPASSEVVVVPDLRLACDNGPDTVQPLCTGFIPVHIPAGSRLAVCAQSSITDGNNRLFGIGLYGLN